jgi:hypothetical protein
MSRDVEIYKNVRELIEDEDYKHVDVARDGEDLVISVHQVFQADRTIDAMELMRVAGFTEIHKTNSIARAKAMWQNSSGEPWHITAQYFQPSSISLSVEWPLKFDPDARELRTGVRAMNRVFNTFKMKMEAPL